ncbi:CO or xanthine dehydrogenase, Mo-binding subunit [Salinihabitans flavidus]|uniref:CO or xanthine dehydrogenase, Mo-binding subunit n=1 Tax=Salinihabitans flavidus TaxID=569882 RepID=A0A1H8VMQ1_9RHOB|nr:molybdopterin cofactor-binding domain-containing protein [Salinihabitans flavidus]SEP16666.1 CO or xanthine dehydrogenase, Mo-binding subunit [Salinihabitans flavidus]
MTFTRIRHPEWEARTTGQLDYARDIAPEGLLVGEVLRCPYPAARIVQLDLSAARAAPGVVAVLAGADLPDRSYIDYGQCDRPAMAIERAVWAGQEVAALAAETKAQALAALALIRVEWEPVPHVTSVVQALARGAPAVHPKRAPNNVATRASRSFGDPSRPSSATRRTRATYGCGPQHHACMEPHSALAHWDAEHDILNLWTPTQSPRNVAAEVAQMLGLTPDQVRLHRSGVGGDFGSRVKAGDIEVLAAHLSMKTDRPVAIRLNRAEEFAFAKRQHETRVDMISHYTEDGQILFRDGLVTVDNGAFIHGGSNQMNYCSILLASHYRLAGAQVDGRSVYTNLRPGGAFRGAGGPQATFAIESQMDEIAADLGLDPIDLRERNLLAPGEETITGWKIGTTAAAECLTELRRRLDWDNARASPPDPDSDIVRGVGVALAMHVSGAIVTPATSKAGAVIEIGQNGGIVLASGCADPGTGEYAVILQLCAAELGIDPEEIELQAMDTATTPFDPGAGSSRATMVTGGAILAASREIAAELRTQAAVMAGCAEQDVVLSGGVAHAGVRNIPLGEVASAHPLAQGGTLRIERETAVAIEPVPMTHTDSGHGHLSPAYAFAAHGVEVEVNRSTGAVRVLRVVAVHDAGTIINPVGAEGQVVGGVAMGLGMALGEQLLWQDGRQHVTGFVDYAMPRADDVPPVEVVFVGAPDPAGPMGAKSISEVALMPVAAAVANAVAHATGARLRDLPMTPDKVLGALANPPHTRPGPLWRRPTRWWTEVVRRAYSHGLFAAVDRYGPSRARAAAPAILSIERPEETEAALALLTKPGAAPLGGGTDLLPSRAQGLAAPEHLVHLAGCTDMHGIKDHNGMLIIGAIVTLASAESQLSGSAFPGDRALAATLRAIATPQIRNMATMAGNLCQQNRCSFLRSGMDCFKRGGAGRPCFAVTGDHRYFHAVMDAGRCQSVTPSDLATMLIAMDAEIVLRGPNGQRVLSAAAFHVGPGETALRRNEIVTELRIPAEARTDRAAFGKLSLSSDGFAIVSAAVRLRLDAEGRVRNTRIVLGGVAATPWRSEPSETRLLGRVPSEASLAAAAEAWIARAHPLRDNEWKLAAGAGLLKRVLREALDTIPTAEPIERNQKSTTPGRRK